MATENRKKKQSTIPIRRKRIDRKKDLDSRVAELEKAIKVIVETSEANVEFMWRTNESIGTLNELGIALATTDTEIVKLLDWIVKAGKMTAKTTSTANLDQIEALASHIEKLAAAARKTDKHDEKAGYA